MQKASYRCTFLSSYQHHMYFIMLSPKRSAGLTEYFGTALDKTNHSLKTEEQKCLQNWKTKSAAWQKMCNLKYETPVNLPMGKNSWARYLVWTEKEIGGSEEKERRRIKVMKRKNLNKSQDVLTRGGPTKPKQSKVLRPGEHPESNTELLMTFQYMREPSRQVIY